MHQSQVSRSWIALIALLLGWTATATAAGGETVLKPKLYALVLGISQHRDPGIAVPFAAKDARDFAAALQNQKGGLYGDVVTRVLTDDAASKSSILDEFDVLTHEVTARDVGIVYFAGQAMLDERDRLYFLGSDSDRERLRATAVPSEELRAALDAVAGKMVVFFDACPSVPADGRRGLASIEGTLNDFAATGGGTVMFTACTGKDVRHDEPALGNGIFTKALVEGLGLPGQPGKADLLGRGTIAVSVLDAFVSERVKTLSGGRQHALMVRPSTVPDFTVAIVRP